MINQSLCCPVCGHCGYMVATDAADLEDFVAAICHYCGHVLDRDGLAACLAGGDPARSTPSPTRTWRPRRSSGRR
jgi:hypothetical protein